MTGICTKEILITSLQRIRWYLKYFCGFQSSNTGGETGVCGKVEGDGARCTLHSHRASQTCRVQFSRTVLHPIHILRQVLSMDD